MTEPASDGAPDRTPRYGDHPELFWDLQPDAPIDLTRPSIVARILREGSLKTIIALVPPSVLREQLPELVMPEHTRRFWNSVLNELDRRNERPAGPGA